MNKDKSNQKPIPEEDAELDSLIDRVIREKTILGDNAVADAIRPLINTMRTANSHIIVDDDD
jgi:hypothetical protein